jgi:VCBS repeat protein
VAHLEIDPTFTRITTGAIVNDGGNSSACAWGDYDNDGFLDLFVTNSEGSNFAEQRNFLYHNNRDGTFSRATNGAVANNIQSRRTCSWADCNNDGRPDLLVGVFSSTAEPRNRLYLNVGGGSFGSPLTSGSSSERRFAPKPRAFLCPFPRVKKNLKIDFTF